MKKLLLLVLLFTMNAYASDPEILDAELSRSSVLVVKDLRPPFESESKTMAWMRTSPDYGISRRNDKLVQPTPIRILQHRVFERLGPDAKLTVHHFVTYLNSQAALLTALQKGPIRALMDPVSGGDAPTSKTLPDRSKFESFQLDDEWRRALYTDEENTRMVSVYVTYLDADVDGRRALVRVVTPVTVKAPQRAENLSIDTCIDWWLQQVAPVPSDTTAAPTN